MDISFSLETPNKTDQTKDTGGPTASFTLGDLLNMTEPPHSQPLPHVCRSKIQDDVEKQIAEATESVDSEDKDQIPAVKPGQENVYVWCPKSSYFKRALRKYGTREDVVKAAKAAYLLSLIHI